MSKKKFGRGCECNIILRCYDLNPKETTFDEAKIHLDIIEDRGDNSNSIAA